MKQIGQYKDILILIFLTALALVLRLYRLDSVPPGLRVDELSNAFIVSQHVLDGDFRFFFHDASGHEGLWHALQAGMMLLFGRSITAIRSASVVLGTLTVPLTYLLGRQLFNRRVGLFASVALAVSFWSLMYSRTGTRHITTVPLMLLTFYFFWQALQHDKRNLKQFVAAGLFMGLTLHTYFAAWNTPLIIGAYCVVIALFQRPLLHRKWAGILLMYALAAVITLPLILSMLDRPDTTEVGRVSEVAAPLNAARDGDYSLLIENTIGTLNMFHADGDSEWLYNIPGRPIFSPAVALIFLLTLLYTTFKAITHLTKRPLSPSPFIFLLIWFCAGLAPSIVSVPYGSLGHTIVAQPATYLILGLFIANRPKSAALNRLCIVIAAAALINITTRDLTTYFADWPTRGNTRFLYHADYYELGRHLTATDQTEIATSSLLAGQWDRLALAHAAPAAQPRLFDPRRAIFLQPATHYTGYPAVPPLYTELYQPDTTPISGFTQRTIAPPATPPTPLVCFENGLCLLSALYDPPLLDLTFQVTTVPIAAVNTPYSFPPLPGTYAGPRLAIFTHLLDAADTYKTGDDGLWIDPDTVRVGDIFRQQHILIPADDTITTIAIGLYDPLDGTRIPTTDQQDQFKRPFAP